MFGIKSYTDETIIKCPACGSEIWIQEVPFSDGDIWFTPACSGCKVGWQENYPTYEEAVEAWNAAWMRKKEDLAWSKNRD